MAANLAANNADNQLKIAAAGGIEAVVAAMTAHPAADEASLGVQVRYVSFSRQLKKKQASCIRRRMRLASECRQDASAYASMRQDTSAYVRIRQHTSAHLSTPQHT